MITTILSDNKMIHIEYFTHKVDEAEKPDSEGNVNTCWRVNKVKIQYNPDFMNDDPEGWIYFTPNTIKLIQEEIQKIHDLPVFRSVDDFELPF